MIEACATCLGYVFSDMCFRICVFEGYCQILHQDFWAGDADGFVS